MDFLVYESEYAVVREYFDEFDIAMDCWEIFLELAFVKNCDVRAQVNG
jgi:hypothetical protein